MIKRTRVTRHAVALACVLTFAVSSFAADAPPAPNPAKQVVKGRQAVFTLIGQNFKPIGDVLQGRTAYNQAEVQKRAERVAFLAQFLNEYFPPESNLGAPDSRAKPDIWKEQDHFAKDLRKLQVDSAAFAKLVSTETSASDAFKSAAAKVAQDCKDCHDHFREK